MNRKQPQKKETWDPSSDPGKSSSRKKALWWVFFVLAAAVFVIAAWQLIQLFGQYRKAENEYEDLQVYVTLPEDMVSEDGSENSSAEEETETITEPEIDFDSLLAINEDIVGWLIVEAVDLSYPILQSSDNDYYLHRTTEGTYNFAGSIFLDYQNSPDFSDCNSIVYGHNMKDGSMFGKLKKFRNEEVYSESLYFWVCTPGENYLYQIFAAYETAVDSTTYTLYSSGGETFREYLYYAASCSEIPTEDLAFDGTETIITLSTCTGNDSTRFVVQGVRIDY